MSVPYSVQRFAKLALASSFWCLSWLASASCSSEAANNTPTPPGGGCGAGFVACGTACVATSSDPLNCGACGSACGAGLFCSVGQCSGACAAGLSACGAACVDQATSTAHCGGCNLACAAGQSCSAGMCTGTATGAGGSTGVGGSGGGLAGSAGAAGATGSGSGYLVGTMCFPACASDATDIDPVTGLKDGYGYEGGRSCLVVGSAPTLTAGRCEPPAITPPVDIPPGDGFYVGGMCLPRCASAATDPDPISGVSDGWGYESGRSCLVVDSAPTIGVPTCVPPAAADGDGYLVSGLCVPDCTHPELADVQGYGYEAQQTCVVPSSAAAAQAARCMLMERTDLPPPGTGFQNGETCFPACGAGAQDVTADGYGWDVNRTCIVPDSTASIQGVPCVPPPNTVTGECPRVLTCPVAGGSTLMCGCTWIEGLAARKATIMAVNGASQYFLASAMMETANLRADYALGDNKTQDAFNAGIAKQNWGMIRRCHPAWSGQTPAQYMTSTAMNSDLALDVTVYNECRSMFGNDWWSAHRAGHNNLGMNTTDIQQFKGAMDWTNEMLTGHLTDDVRFWVTVQAI